MMKIAHVITTISHGGAEMQLLLLAQEQVRQGHNVTVFPLKGSPDLANRFTAEGVSVDFSLFGVSAWKQAFRCYRCLFYHYEVVHAHLPQAEIVTRFSKFPRRFVSRHYGGQFYPGRTYLISRVLSRFATANCSGVIAISKFVKNNLEARKEISQAIPIHIVTYGFAPDRFVSQLSQRCRLGEERFLTVATQKKALFTCFARLSEEKNLSVLIRAWQKVVKVKPNYELRIYGEGPQRGRLELLCKEIGLNPGEILPGRTSLVADVMNQSTAVVFPSLFEGFGMVLLESMSLNVPVLASRIPICEEVMGTEGSAVFFNPTDEEELAEKIINFDQYLSRDFATYQAKQIQKFGMRVVAERTTNIYCA